MQKAMVKLKVGMFVGALEPMAEELELTRRTSAADQVLMSML